ncbi:MAG: ORF6N domain-containing protein [Bryobacteraceae bacterium]
MRSQTVISSWGGRRRPPYAFTEQGVAMLLLPSQRASLRSWLEKRARLGHSSRPRGKT